MDRKNLKKSKIISLGVLALLVILVLTPLGEKAYDRTVRPVNSYNTKYLDESQSDSLKVMVPIIGARAIADAVEGSTISVKIFGTGGDVEIGDLVQPMLDGLNIAWKGSVISLIYSSIAKYLLLGSFEIARPFIVVCLSFWIIFLLLCPLESSITRIVFAVRKIRDFTLLISLTFLLILPLTVFLSGKLSEATTKPLEPSILETFDKVGDIADMTEYKDIDGYKEKAEYIFAKANALIKWSLWEAPKEVISSSIKWLVIKLLNGILFPLASLVFLIWIVRDILYPTLGLSDAGVGHGDIQQLRDFLASHKKREPATETFGGSAEGPRPPVS